MIAALIIAIIANAFIILIFSLPSYYKLHRYEGQLLYIKAIFIGALITIFTFSIDVCLNLVEKVALWLPDNSWEIGVKNSHIEGLFLFFIMTLIVTFLYCIIERLIIYLIGKYRFGCKSKMAYKKAKAFLMYSILSDSPLDKLLFSSYNEYKVLMITMSDRKVYIGIINQLGEPNEKDGPNQEISLVPIYSGYRDINTLSLRLTVKYDKKDIFVVLKQDQIISACEFVDSLYLQLNNDKNWQFISSIDYKETTTSFSIGSIGSANEG